MRTSASLSDDSVGLLNPSGLDGDSMLEFDGKVFPMTLLLLLFVAVGVDGIFSDETPNGDAKPISSISSIDLGVVC